MPFKNACRCKPAARRRRFDNSHEIMQVQQAMKAFFFFMAALISHCHSPDISAASDSAQAPTRAPSFTRKGPESCLHCHSGEGMRAVLASPHGDPDVPGTPAASHGCESCHGKGSIHISRAHGGEGFPRLTEFGRGKRGSPRDEKLNACLSCHADDSMGESQILFIGSIHDRPTINCSNCHKAHEKSDPMGNLEAQIKTCSRCHRRDIREHPAVEGEAIDMSSQACSNCHDVHVSEGVSGGTEE